MNNSLQPIKDANVLLAYIAYVIAKQGYEKASASTIRYVLRPSIKQHVDVARMKQDIGNTNLQNPIIFSHLVVEGIVRLLYGPGEARNDDIDKSYSASKIFVEDTFAIESIFRFLLEYRGDRTQRMVFDQAIHVSQQDPRDPFLEVLATMTDAMIIQDEENIHE